MSTLRSLSRDCTEKNKLKSSRELQNCAGGTDRPYGGRKHEAGGDTEVTHTVPARPSHADSLQSSIHKKGYNSQPDTQSASQGPGVSYCLDTTRLILRTARNMALTLTDITVHYVLQLLTTPHVF